MFALDHTHYSRCLSVHVADLLSFEEKNNKLYEEMTKGFFLICKSKRHFSNIAIDQAHEQNSKLIKIDGGAIGIFENEFALLKWTVAALMVSDMLKNADIVNGKTREFNYHHKDNESFNKKFVSDKQAFTNALEEVGNLFLEEGDQLVHIKTKQLLSEKACKLIVDATEIGEKLLETFVKELLIEGNSSIYDKIKKKNNLALYRRKNSLASPKTKLKIASLSSDCRLYSNLYLASQSRQGNLEDFFCMKTRCIQYHCLSMGNCESVQQSQIFWIV